MQGEDNTPFLHELRQQAVGFHNHQGVAGFQRNHDLVELPFDTHIHPFHGRLGHGQRRVAVQVGDVLAQRTVVQADPDRRSVLLADIQQFQELAARFVVIAVEIARVDADLLHMRGYGEGGCRGEMDIGHQRGCDPLGTQQCADGTDVFHIGHRRHGDADELCSGGSHAAALFHRGFNLVRVRIAHRLDDDAFPGADEHVTDLYCPCFHILNCRLLF